MNILDRYVLKEFIKIFTLILISLVSLYVIVDFFERIRMFLSNSATLLQIASYFFFNIPNVLSQMIPVSILLATLLTFGTFSKNNEITAMKANGLSLYRIVLPVIIFSFMTCIGALLFDEFITPHANQNAKYIKYIEIQKRKKMGTFKRNEMWYRADKGIYNFKVFNAKEEEIKGIILCFLDQNMKVYKRVDAQFAEWKDEGWKFYNILITTFPDNNFPVIERVKSRYIDIPETPSDFSVVQKDAEEMGFLELNKFVKKIQSEGYDATRYLTDMHGKIAFPLVSLILSILAISFSLKGERSGGLSQSIGLGIIIGFSYWVVYAFALSLGRSGALPPMLAAWTANLIFGTAALIMLMRVKT